MDYKSVTAYDKSGKAINHFESISDCAFHFKIGTSRIIEYCKGKHKFTRNGITFRYGRKRKIKC